MLADTKSVQKEINHLSGVLDRTFAVTDELIFKDAKRDEAVRRAYKLLAALHDVSLFTFLLCGRSELTCVTLFESTLGFLYAIIWMRTVSEFPLNACCQGMPFF